MKTNEGFSCRSFIIRLVLTCTMLNLCACAQSSATHDKQRAHYENLESEMLRNQKAENRRLRDEYRAENTIQPSNSETLSATEQNTRSEISLTKNKVRETAESPSLNDLTTPVVTQIVVSQSSKDNEAQNWIRQNYPSPIDGSPLCVIASNPVIVQNGDLQTQVIILISDDAVFLRTDATFDKTALDTGFQIDAGFPIPFDRYLNELTAVIDNNYSIVLNSMKSGLTLSVSFSYNPQLSTSNTHVVEIDLDSFNRVWSEKTECTTN